MSRLYVVLKRVGRLVKFLLICLVLTVIVLLGWRLSATKPPSDLRGLIPTSKLEQLYQKQGKELYMFDQNYDIITRAPKNSGYFGVPEAVFIPDANQVQILFRYNKSTIAAIAKDKGLEAVPSRDEKLFDLSLVFYIDLTPDNKEDNYEKDSENVARVRILPSEERSAQTTLYNFYRYSFDVDGTQERLELAELLESDRLIAVHAEIYYIEDKNYDNAADGAICIYDFRAKNQPVKLSGNDIKALQGKED